MNSEDMILIGFIYIIVLLVSILFMGLITLILYIRRGELKMDKSKVIIAITLLLMGAFLLINGMFEKRDDIIEPTKAIDVPMETQSTTSSINISKTTKKVKTTSKMANRNSVKTFNIKASKEEMMNYAKKLVVSKWGEKEWEPFYQIVLHESNWNPNSINKSSGACGLFQMYPCKKTNAKYKVSYEAQIETGIYYIASRYGKPSNAWDFWLKYKWY